jgi:hypothetical protein
MSLLLSILQRTKFESKSQHFVEIRKELQLLSCYQYYKEQNLKANHNRYSCFQYRKTKFEFSVVINTTKNKI